MCAAKQLDAVVASHEGLRTGVTLRAEFVPTLSQPQLCPAHAKAGYARTQLGNM